jgi:hypothetical protein
MINKHSVKEESMLKGTSFYNNLSIERLSEINCINPLTVQQQLAYSTAKYLNS